MKIENVCVCGGVGGGVGGGAGGGLDGGVQNFSMYIRHWNGLLIEIVCFDFRAVWCGSDKKRHFLVFFHSIERDPPWL